MKDFIWSCFCEASVVFAIFVIFSIAVVMFLNVGKQWAEFREEKRQKKPGNPASDSKSARGRLFLDYQVVVRRNDGELLDRDKVIEGIGVSADPTDKGYFSFLGYTSIGGKIVTDTVLYQTDCEDLALSVYANAKRNLDAQIYSVSFTTPK